MCINNQGSEILMFHILEGINEKNRNGTNKTFIERVCNVPGKGTG
jgi:hypothetical protein